MPRLIRWLATAALFLILPTAARAAEFGPSETGCPAFWVTPEDGTAITYGGDVSAPGPFGTTNMRITGVGLEVVGDTVTATIRVLDMQRQVMPGFLKVGWRIFFSVPGGGVRSFRVNYDLPSDTFSYYAFRGGDTLPATGSVTLGVNGGLRISAKLADLNLAPGRVVQNLGAESFGFVHYFYMPDPNTGTYTYRSSVSGPESVPLVPCPGATIVASDIGGGTVEALGYALPAAADQLVALEVQTASGWQEIGTARTDDLGGYIAAGKLAPGTWTVRVRLESRYLGAAASTPTTVTLR